ncbi:hypothetical protein ASF10_16135 [Flavobacterium sp. Leaf82]|uniref:hypothetical protein n=1 Tax=unclassified Flavobacterium TaxID=196869 RepID=UPI0006F42D14|nr:hypothetical protein [Flavobacterium sp. Leaf82]KQO20603.1 hypothetical protein ASF10_16135 [Flavobacterium sp. Leaf82]
MIEITYEEVKEFLLETEFSYQPGQIEISFPILKRIHRRLQQGNSFNAIKIISGRIVDGHHRYICHQLLDLIPETITGGANSSQVKVTWKEINLTRVDYDDAHTRRLFAERYDK